MHNGMNITWLEHSHWIKEITILAKICLINPENNPHWTINLLAKIDFGYSASLKIENIV